MDVSIVCFSHTGNNELLAQHLADRIECGVIRITEKKRRTTLTTVLDVLFGRLPRIQPIEKPLGAYDHFVLIAPVWAGGLASPLRSFLHRERQRLHDYSFITLCGYDNPGQREKLTAELTARAGLAPKAVCELCVSDLFPPNERRSIRRITPYRIQDGELEHYDEAIEDFVKAAGIKALLEERTCHC